MINPIAALIERLNHHYWSVVLPFNPETDTPRTDAELQQKLFLITSQMEETTSQMRLQREESKRKREERRSNNSTREINKQLELTASALESRASELSSLLSSMRAERMQREAGKKTASQPQQARLADNDDKFLRVLSELAKLTQRSKAEVLGSALNLYYRAVTLPAADLELLRSFLEDLEKKQGIDWSATPPPP